MKNTKRALSVILAAVLLLAFAPTGAHAAHGANTIDISQITSATGVVSEVNWYYMPETLNGGYFVIEPGATVTVIGTAAGLANGSNGKYQFYMGEGSKLIWNANAVWISSNLPIVRLTGSNTNTYDVEIIGGTIENISFGEAILAADGCRSLNISGGTLSSGSPGTDGCAVQIFGSGCEVAVTGGSVTGVAAIRNDSGSVLVSGGGTVAGAVYCLPWTLTDAASDSGTGWDWDHGSLTLTLTDFVYSTFIATALAIPGGSKIILYGENSLSTSFDGLRTSCGISAGGDLTITGPGSLTLTGGNTKANNNYSIGLFVDGDLTVSCGALTATGGSAANWYSYGIKMSALSIGGNGTTVIAKGETAAFTIPYTVPAGYYYWWDANIFGPAREGTSNGAITIENSTSYKFVKIVAPTHTHDFGTGWESDAVNHWHECACGDKSDTAAHTPGAAATCTTPQTCTVCDYELAPATGHSYGTAWLSDAANHWHECACGDKSGTAAHTPGAAATCTTPQTCTFCNYELAPATGHTPGTAWLSDATNHWHECACGDKSGLAAHTPGAAATCTTAQTCTVCDYELAPATGHSPSTAWLSDAANHWHECACGDKSDVAAHTPGGWLIDLAETAATDGSKHMECTACGYVTATETIPATGGTLAAPTILGDKNVKLAYLGEQDLAALVVGESLIWSSSNEKYIKVDSATGKITSQKAFWKTGSATIKAENSEGSVEFNVKVRPTFWQWLMTIFLFGWIWY